VKTPYFICLTSLDLPILLQIKYIVMRIAYSRFCPLEDNVSSKKTRTFYYTKINREQFAYKMAVKGYKRALKKYASEIAQIQTEFPGWMPKFK
jgi:hypothetical protein